MSATATTPDIQTLLDASGAPKDVKASAWDAYQQAGNQQDFQSRFDKLQIPQETKASLWDMKFSRQASAAPSSPVIPPIPMLQAARGTAAQASPVPTLTKPQADAAITQATNIGGAPSTVPQKPLGFDLGTPPVQPRDLASGIVSEQREQRAGAPLRPGQRPIAPGVTAPQFQPVPENVRSAPPAANVTPGGLFPTTGSDTYPGSIGSLLPESLRSTGYSGHELPAERTAALQRQEAGLAPGEAALAEKAAHPYQTAVELGASVNPVTQGAYEAAGGAKDIATAQNRQEAYKGGARIVGGTMDALMPAFTAGLIERPVQVGTGLITGMLTAKGAELATKAAGGAPGTQELANSIGFFIPSIVGLNIRGAANERGVGVVGSAFGGKVGAGAAYGEGRGAVVGRVGPFRAGVKFGEPEPSEFSAQQGPPGSGQPVRAALPEPGESTPQPASSARPTLALPPAEPPSAPAVPILRAPQEFATGSQPGPPAQPATNMAIPEPTVPAVP